MHGKRDGAGMRYLFRERVRLEGNQTFGGGGYRGMGKGSLDQTHPVVRPSNSNLLCHFCLLLYQDTNLKLLLEIMFAVPG